MRITPNQISVSRVVLLPLPISLFFLSGPVGTGYAGKAIALALFLALGLTDFLDGYLARRYGSTEFGKFLDPIADKIFMAAIFMPLLYLDERVPLWPVVIMFMREFLITELRTIYNFRGANFTTSIAGKIKMNVQGFGVGIIAMVAFFPPLVSSIVVGLTVIGMGITAIVWKLKKGRLNEWFRYVPAFFAAPFVFVTFFPPEVSIYLLVLCAMLVSVYSGAEYLVKGFGELKAYLAQSPIVRTAYILVSCFIIPTGLLILTGVKSENYQILFWPLLLTLALAFTSSGLDNYLSLKKIPYSYGYKWLKLVVQLAFLSWALHLYLTGETDVKKFLVAVLVIALGELAYFLGYFTRHFSQFVQGTRALSAEEAAKGSEKLGRKS